MVTIKSFTTLQQSKKLAEILPLESADGCWRGTTNPLAANTTFWLYTKYIKGKGIPAWSLAALLGVLPNDTSLLYFDDAYQMVYDKKPYVISNKFDNPVDACVAMIEKLHELKML